MWQHMFIKSCSCGRAANLALSKPAFENQAFLTHLTFFGHKKIQAKSGFFAVAKLGSGKTLSGLHIYYKSLVSRVYDHAGCTECFKDFTVAQKMIDVFNQKQTYNCNY